MNPEETIVPLMGMLIIFGGPIAALIVWRVLQHNERMEMIRRGMQPMDPRSMRNAAKYGWAPVPPGPPPPPGAATQMPQMNYAYDPGFYAQTQLRRGVQVACVGLALLIGLSFIGFHGDGSVHYGPWLLGGLIPLFVGIAQIITALIGGARIGGGGAPSANYGPPPGVGAAPPPGPQAPAGPFGPTGWRPGSTPEIEKPAGPPDYR